MWNSLQVPSSPTVVDSVTGACTDTGSGSTDTGSADAADDVADAPLTASTAGQESSPCTEVASQPGDSHTVEDEAAADSHSRGREGTNSAASPTKPTPEPHPWTGETANDTDNGQRESNRETLLKRECKAAGERASAEAARADGLQQRVDELQSSIAEKDLMYGQLESRSAKSESECAAQLKKLELRDSEIQRLKVQSGERQGAAERQAKLRQLLKGANQQAQKEAQIKMQQAKSLKSQQAAQMRDSEKLCAEVRDLKQQLIEAQEAGAGLALTSMSAAAAGVNAAATAATAAAAAEVVVLKRHVAKLQKERAIAQQQRDGALIAAELAEERLTLRLT